MTNLHSAPASQEPQSDSPTLGESLSDEQVTAFARLALDGMDTEYPNKPSNVLASDSDVRSPKELHPAFYGCFDWHSSVHGHWMLVRLLRLHPDCTVGDEIRERLSAHLTQENLVKETEYFEQKHNRSFERMYGWAWYFRLATELEAWDDPQGNEWRAALEPLENLLIERALDYLPRLQFPIRTGVHPNTAFALGQLLDYAQQTKNDKLATLLRQRSLDFFSNDRNYPANYEPSGEDFFSAALCEVDLMRRVLSPEAFSTWLTKFEGEAASERAGNASRLSEVLRPVDVSDTTDGKIVHLAGLDLSRAWCLNAAAAALPDDDPRREPYRQSAKDHLSKGLEYVFSGHYEGEHWLATFAVYLQAQVGVDRGEQR